MFKKILLFLGLLLLTNLSFSNVQEYCDGDNVIVIKASVGNDEVKTDAISASIDGHNLTIIFLANLGQVTIKVLDAYDVEIELMSTPTPTGQIIYIPLAGRYTVLFTLSDGDVYYGEFEVTD